MVNWTTDGLSIPEISEVVETVTTQHHVYHLMHDTGPNRWYVVRSNDGETERTVVYSTRNAPALRTLWTTVVLLDIGSDD